MIKIQCDKCGSTYNVSDEFAGKTGSCKKCGNKIPIPGPAEPSQPAVTAPEPAHEREIPQWKRDRIRRAARNKWIGAVLLVAMVSATAVGLWIVKPWEGVSKKSNPTKVASGDPPTPDVDPPVQPPKLKPRLKPNRGKPAKKPTASTKPVAPPRPATGPAPVPDLEIIMAECQLDMHSSQTEAFLVVMVKANRTGDYKDIACKFTDVKGKGLVYTNTEGNTVPRVSDNKLSEAFEKGKKKSLRFIFKKPAVPSDKIKYPWLTFVRGSATSQPQPAKAPPGGAE